MKEYILKANFDGIAECLHQNWLEKKKTASIISNPKIEEIYNYILQNGGKAAKISGAGGGGFMIIWCDPQRRYDLIRALKNRKEGKTKIVDFVELEPKLGQFMMKTKSVEYLNDLMIDTTLTSNVEYYANIIKENALKRQLIAAGSNIIEETFKNSESKISLEMAEKLIFEIAQQKSSSQMEALSSLLYETMEQLEYRCSNKGSYTGVPSGFYELDAMTAGFQIRFINFSSASFNGKTAFALNIAQNVAIRSKIPVAIFSLEMSKIQLTQRVYVLKPKLMLKEPEQGNCCQMNGKKFSQSLMTCILPRY